MERNWVKRLTEEFAGPLPGIEAQLRMSPKVTRPQLKDRPLKKSGVLLLLYPVKGKFHTVFIQRTEYNGVHSGQVSLPGGMYEPTDISLAATALREAKEETGVSEKEPLIIGQLTCLHIPVSNIEVYPFVAVTMKQPEFIPEPAEVKYLIEASMDELTDSRTQKIKMMQIAGVEIEVPYYDIRGNHIWGATAMIVSEFLEVVKRM